KNNNWERRQSGVHELGLRLYIGEKIERIIYASAQYVSGAEIDKTNSRQNFSGQIATLQFAGNELHLGHFAAGLDNHLENKFSLQRWILPQRAVIDRENAALLLVHRAANCLIGATAATTGRDQITFFAGALADSGACPRSRALPPTAAAGFCTETAKAAAGTIDTGGFSARQSDAAGIAAQR